MKVDLDYVTSKLDYKNKDEILDLYTLRVRRTTQEPRETVLAEALSALTDPGALA